MQLKDAGNIVEITRPFSQTVNLMAGQSPIKINNEVTVSLSSHRKKGRETVLRIGVDASTPIAFEDPNSPAGVKVRKKPKENQEGFTVGAFRVKEKRAIYVGTYSIRYLGYIKTEDSLAKTFKIESISPITIEEI